MIKTIEELDSASDVEIESVLAMIDIKNAFYTQAEKDATRTGLTAEEYEKLQDAGFKKSACKSCNGTGIKTHYPRSVGTIHASAAHYCRTRLYYDVVAEEAPIDSFPIGTHITFQIGHAIHDYVQSTLSRAFLDDEFEEEVKVDLPEAFVFGSSADGLFKTEDYRAVLEIKSIGSEFENLVKPKKSHLVQAMGIYATALDAPFVVFLYVSKKWPHPIKQFVVPYDKKVYENWKRTKLKFVEQGLIDGKPPIADSAASECNDCRYAHICDQNLSKKRKAIV